MNNILNELNPSRGSENKIKSIFILFVALIFLSDFITKVLIVEYNSFFTRGAGIVKLIFELLMLFYILKKRKINQVLILGFILMTSFIISNLNVTLINNEISYSGIIKNIYYLNRYLYIFIFIAFLKLYNISFTQKDSFIKLFKTVLYINSIFIILGFIFEIELFRSFNFTSRFGYDGFFSKHGEAAYYYMLFISILYYEYLSSKSKSKLIYVFAVSLVSILLGKKAVLLFLFLLLILHFIFIMKRVGQVSLVLLILVIGLFVFRKIFFSFIFAVFPFWKEAYENLGFIGAITSMRSILLADFINYISVNWNIINYLFGIGAYEKDKVEFEFIDVFLFFGLTGVCVFIYLLKKYFYDRGSIISRCLFLAIFLTSFFSGALFISITGMMFFYVILQWINSSEFN